MENITLGLKSEYKINSEAVKFVENFEMCTKAMIFATKWLWSFFHSTNRYNNMLWNAIHRLQHDGLHLFTHAISPFPCAIPTPWCRETKTRFQTNFLRVHWLRGRVHGVRWGRSRAALDFHIYTSGCGAGKRNRASGGRWASCCSLAVSRASIYWRWCAICGDRCFDLRSAQKYKWLARGEELCSRAR